MICAEVVGLLPAYLDHELRGSEARSIADHLANCRVCQAALEQQRDLDARVELLRTSVPSPGMASVVMRHIGGEPAAARATVARRPTLAALALPLVAVVIVMAGLLAALLFLPGRRAASPPPVPIPPGLYVLNAGPDGVLLVLHPETLSPVARVVVGANPKAMALSHDKRWIYVAAGLPDIPASEQGGLALTGIWVIDLATYTVADVIPVGYAVWDVAAGSRPGQIFLAYQPTGRYLQPTGPSDPQMAERVPGQLLSLDVASRKLTHVADLGPLPRGLVATPDGKLVYAISHDVVDYDETTVWLVDVAAKRTLKTLALPGTEAITIAPDGGRAFVASTSEPYIWGIDRQKQEPVAYRVAGLAPGSTARSLAVSRDGLMLAVAFTGQPGGLLMLDASRLDTLLVLPLAEGYQAVTFGPGHSVYAATPAGRLDIVQWPGGQIVGSADGMGNIKQMLYR